LKSLRVGCVKYLNARPLIHGWAGQVRFDHPSTLCTLLGSGELDLALVSSFEFLRNPIYRIVDHISICSDGPVYSVMLAYSGEISEISEIALDPAAETSVALLRCLLAERGLSPRLVRNIDCQSVRPAGLEPAEATATQPGGFGTAESNSAGHTGNMPVFQRFDPHRPLLQTRRNLPHWEQAGATYFVTFRLADAVPAQVAKQWREEMETWRKFHPEPWDAATSAEYRSRFLQPREDWLDQGHGSCLLRNSSAAGIVAEALRFFDGQRYYVDAFVVMPNHVHVLVQPLPGFHLNKIVHSWKSYTARQINKVLGHSGTVWMQESFDRIVRDWDSFVRCRTYIARNPEKARLRSGEFVLSATERLRNIDCQSVRPAGLEPAEATATQPGGFGTAKSNPAERTGKTPTFPVERHAQLLIGDQAIRFRQQHGSEFRIWDLGDEWKKVVGLPFVYAVWLVRPEIVEPERIALRLRELRDKNIASLDDLIAQEREFDPNFCAQYYREHLRFNLGANEKEGLRAFQRLCEKHGLLRRRAIEFNTV
jgi:predicted solute-binding protein/REP element-mobilizing transposase RayT